MNWKNVLLVGVFLSCTILSVSYGQESGKLLSNYDACQMQAPPATQFGIAALATGPPLVKIAYVIPSNRSEQPNAVSSLQHAIKTGQKWFEDQMEQNDLGRKTFIFETEADGETPLVHVVHVTETDDFLRGDLWGRTIQAAANAGISVWAEGELWVLVAEAHLMMPDGTVIGGTALGASNGTGNSPGIAMIGGNALPLLQAEMITDDTPYDGKVLPAIGPYPLKQDVSFAWFEGSTFSSVASSWYGALWHEMGHAFGLAHDFRNDNNAHGNLMGNGLRGSRGSLFPDRYPQDYTRLAYSSALILNVSHYFNREKNVTPLPVVSYSNPGSVVPEQGLVKITFHASDDDLLHLAHLRYDGNTVAEVVLKENDSDVTFATPYYLKGTSNAYTIAVHDQEGNASYTNFNINVAGGSNQAPVPFIRINPPVPDEGESITLDAWQSTDPDHASSLLLASWDVDNDGQFDTQPSTDKTFQHQYPQGGNYFVRLKLTDPVGGESISTPVSVKIPGDLPPTANNGEGLRGQYFNNRDLTGTPAIVRTDPELNFSWNLDPPATGVNADDFSVRWEGQLEAPLSGSYVFSTFTDDGVRLWINGVLVIDHWEDISTHMPSTNVSTAISLSRGVKYDIKMEYYEHTGAAVAVLRWTYPGQDFQVIPQSRLYPAPFNGIAGTGLKAEYFNNVSLSGTPVVNRIDAQVDFTYNLASPAPGINADNFSVRWSGLVEAPVTGNYVFSTVSDDGVRLWINGAQVINNWTDHAPTTNNSQPIALIAGTKYDIRMEFYERTASAVAKLLWAFPGQAQQVVPQSKLYPPGGGDTTPPSVPAMVRLGARPGATDIILVWQASTDNVGVTGYEIFRDGVSVGTTSEIFFIVGGLLPATTYSMTVRARDAAGNWSAQSDPFILTTASVLGTGNGLQGQYFNNISLTGTPVVTRVDPQVDFTWNTASPAAGINADNFSVRWTGHVEAPATGDFVFSTVSDDGVRLWINGVLVINNWTDHGPTTNNSSPIPLVFGDRYEVRMEFYERTGGAVARLLWAYPGQAQQPIPQFMLHAPAGQATGTGLSGAYFNNVTLSGSAVVTRTDAQVNFEWNTGSPVAGINADNFSVRWTGQVEAPTTANFVFSTISDDGVRLWINDVQVIDNWTDHAPGTNSSSPIAFVGGVKYNIRMEFYERSGGAVARLLWTYPGQTQQPIPQTRLFPTTSGGGIAGTGLSGAYFNNASLTGSPVLNRIDSQVDFLWNSAAPGVGVNADNYSVRWTGQLEAPASGNYVFSTVSDDGVRLWINGLQVINNWTDHGAVTNNSAAIALNAGTKYDVRMEYYEHTGLAVARLLWAYPGQAQQLIPQSRLYPDTTPASLAAMLAGVESIDSVSTTEDLSAVTVYPNPASDGVLYVEHHGKSGDLHIVLLDSYGNVLMQRPLSQQPVQQLDVSALKKGLHYLKVVGRRDMKIFRVVLE